MHAKPILCVLFTFGLGVCFAHPSVSLVMDSKGNVYYSDLTQVWKIDILGGKSVVVPHVHTHELYIDESDNLYGEHVWYNGEAANTWGYYVWRLSPSGSLEKIIPPTEGFLTNFSFVHDSMGNMYWADRKNECQKVTRKNKDGTQTTLGDACMQNIRWMTVTDDGLIYLVDLYDLKKIDKQGHVSVISLQLQEKNWTQFFVNDVHALMGLNTDQQENIYVAVYSGRLVKKISPAGKVTVAAETSIPWSPTGTLLTPNGDFWILECSVTNAVRVEKITKDGRRIIY